MKPFRWFVIMACLFLLSAGCGADAVNGPEDEVVSLDTDPPPPPPPPPGGGSGG